MSIVEPAAAECVRAFWLVQGEYGSTVLAARASITSAAERHNSFRGLRRTHVWEVYT